MPKSLYEIYKNVPKSQLLSKAQEADISDKVNNNNRFGSGIDGRIAPDNIKQNIAVQIAYRRAEELLDWTGGEILPLDADIINKHPGVDPIGKYSEVDMLFAERLDRVKRTVPLCEGPNQEVLTKILRNLENPVAGNSKDLYILTNAMKKECKDIRVNRTAAMLCDDKVCSEMLEKQANILKNGNVIRNYDKLLTCMEQIAGLKSGELENKDKLTIPGSKETVNGTKGIMDRLLAQYAPNKQLHLGNAVERSSDQNPTVYFPSFQNIIKQNWYAFPGNWGKEPKLEAMAPKDSPYLQKMIAQYTGAVAKKTMDDILPANAKNIQADRNMLVIVDGKTIQEHLAEYYRNIDPNMDQNLDKFRKWYAENRDTLGMQILASGLESGKHVEAFIPNADGDLPEKPVQIKKSGDPAKELKPVTLNAWQRFFSHLGFYKKEVARADEYKRTMEARERVKDQYIVHNVKSLSDENIWNSFFGQILGEQKNMSALADEGGMLENSYIPRGRAGRTSYVSGCIFKMLADQNNQYKLEDLIDPTKLVNEKQEAAREYLKLAVTDHKSISQIYADGQKNFIRQLDRILKNVDLYDQKQYAKFHKKFGNTLSVLAIDSDQDTRNPELNGPNKQNINKNSDAYKTSKLTADIGNTLSYFNKGHYARAVFGTPLPGDKKQLMMDIINMDVANAEIKNKVKSNENPMFSNCLPDEKAVPLAQMRCANGNVLDVCAKAMYKNLQKWQDIYSKFHYGDISKELKLDLKNEVVNIAPKTLEAYLNSKSIEATHQAPQAAPKIK